MLDDPDTKDWLDAASQRLQESYDALTAIDHDMRIYGQVAYFTRDDAITHIPIRSLYSYNEKADRLAALNKALGQASCPQVKAALQSAAWRVINCPLVIDLSRK